VLSLVLVLLLGAKSYSEEHSSRLSVTLLVDSRMKGAVKSADKLESRIAHWVREFNKSIAPEKRDAQSIRYDNAPTRIEFTFGRWTNRGNDKLLEETLLQEVSRPPTDQHTVVVFF
jgi:hypothetical protein